MSLSVTGFGTGLDNEAGKLTKLFITGTELQSNFDVQIKEKSGSGLWKGKIKKVYNKGTLALAHVNTIQMSAKVTEDSVFLTDEENVEVVVTDPANGNSGSDGGNIPIFP